MNGHTALKHFHERIIELVSYFDAVYVGAETEGFIKSNRVGEVR